MKMFRLTFWAAPLFLIVAGAMVSNHALAHHSPAAYDRNRQVLIQGTITNVYWRNPHIAFMLKTHGEDGSSKEMRIEGVSVSEAMALGLKKEALATGTDVVVRAYPGRRGNHALGLEIRTSNGTVLPLDTDQSVAVIPVELVKADSIAGRWTPLVEDFNRVFFDTMLNWPFTHYTRAELEEKTSQPESALGICVDIPPPLLSVFTDMREITVQQDKVVIHFEAQGQQEERVIHLNQTEHPAGVKPTLLGYSIGHWEGDTLVVDTAAFAPSHIGLTWGVASGTQKHIVERFSLADDHHHLQYDLSVEDPENLSKPATFSMRWLHRPDLEPTGIVCDKEMATKIMKEVL